jgi:hypothetical protein
MYLGTTPTISIKVNEELELDNIKQIWFTISSNTHKITKTIDDVFLDDEEKTISITLSQEETLLFSAGYVYVQIRVLTKNDEAYATPITKTRFERILEGGIIHE